MRLADKILRIMQAERISEQELAHMVEHAAITTQDGFNRLYHHWVFKIDGEKVLNMEKAEPTVIGDGSHHAYEEHDVCRGTGCSTCGWKGFIFRLV